LNNSTDSFFKLDRYEKMIDGSEEKELVKASQLLTSSIRNFYSAWGIMLKASSNYAPNI